MEIHLLLLYIKAYGNHLFKSKMNFKAVRVFHLCLYKKSCMYFVYRYKMFSAVAQRMSEQISWSPSPAPLPTCSIRSVSNSCTQVSHGASEPSVVKKDNSHDSFAWTEYMWPPWHWLSSLCVSFTYKGADSEGKTGDLHAHSYRPAAALLTLCLYACVPVSTLCNSLSSFASFYIDWLLECNRRDLRNGNSWICPFLIASMLYKMF